MGRKDWEQNISSGLAVIALFAWIASPAFAQKGKGGPSGKTILVKAVLVTDCPTPPTPPDGEPVATGIGCQTEKGLWHPVNGFQTSSVGKYSLLSGFPAPPIGAPPNGGYEDGSGDGSANDGVYLPDPLLGVQSEILTHNTVFTLDTLDTLDPVAGTVISTTITLTMHFYNIFYERAPNALPGCWGIPSTSTWFDENGFHTIAAIDITQAVNWSIFSSNSLSLTDMEPGISNPGFSRLDFNVRGVGCENNIFRFFLKWAAGTGDTNEGGGITITRSPDDPTSGKRQWVIQTDEFGTATLEGQGGRAKQTVKYGSWRLPFKIVLTEL